ncbi:MAG TPA: PA2778 family cysteine peptidase [Burkholderiaceae bacterium]|nr:PA2778 family cysteine peptidase [Burkholderiaceae bacterium]
MSRSAFNLGTVPSTPALAGVVLLCLALLAACAAPQASRLRTQDFAELPPRHLIADVPFVGQTPYHCGPAALSMVAQHAEVPVDANAMQAKVFVPALKGALQAEMLAAPRRFGLMSIEIEPSLRALLRHVAAGTPVIVLQNLSLPVQPLWHYAVVIGYDLPANEIVLHSGNDPQMRLSIDAFEHTWARSKHWAMIAARPDRVPESVGEAAYVRAAAALERVDLRAAHRAYVRGTLRWPDSRYLQFGLANTYAAQQQQAQSREVLERLVRSFPDWGDAWNNLAVIRAELGDRAGALDAIERAVQLGGPHAALYLETRERLAKTPAR